MTIETKELVISEKLKELDDILKELIKRGIKHIFTLYLSKKM